MCVLCRVSSAQGTKEDVALNEEEELVVINRLHQARRERMHARTHACMFMHTRLLSF